MGSGGICAGVLRPPTGNDCVARMESKSGSIYGCRRSGVHFPNSTRRDSISGFMGPKNYNHTIRPGVASEARSTAFIHGSGQGQKGGLVDIAPAGRRGKGRKSAGKADS